MTGNRRAGIVVQERDYRLLRELSVMRVVDREQAKVVAGFGSTTRANARLLALTRAGLLRRFFLGTTAGGQKALYTFSTRAAQLVGAAHRGLQRRKDEASATDVFVQHQFALNEVYCALKFRPIPVAGTAFRRWESFDRPLASSLLPDGYVELATPPGILAAFLEIDLGTERAAVWEQKVRKYLQLAASGEYERQFGNDRFRVLVIADSERRMHSIRKTVAGITDKIFWFSTFERVRGAAFFGSVWFRSTGDATLPLIKEMP